MGHAIGHITTMKWAVLFLVLIPTLAWAGPGPDPNDGAAEAPPYPGAPREYFIYIVVILILVGAFFSLALIRSAVSVSGWSLADALSEEVEVTEQTPEDDSGATTFVKDDGKPVTVTRMCASSSRLIALMGMMVILLMFLGFGAFALFSFGKTGKMPPSVNDAVRFLVAGLTLFAPYAVNKFASIFESLSPKPPRAR